nr:uncharacterized protein LOC127316143 [Lolium perenne]
MAHRGARVMLQSGDLGSNSGRAGGGKAPGDAGDQMEAAPPAIGRRSTAGGDVTRRPGQVLWRGGARRRGGAGRGHGEDRLLTVSTGSLAARSEELGIGGERWLPETGTRLDSGDSGLSGGSRVVEEVDGVEAEPLVVAAGRGDAGNGGDGERPARLGFGHVSQREREEGGRQGKSEDGRKRREDGASSSSRQDKQEVAGEPPRAARQGSIKEILGCFDTEF